MGIETLTKREEEVLDLLCQSMARKSIAEALNISPRTLTVHVQNITKKRNSPIAKVVHDEIRLRTTAEVTRAAVLDSEEV